MIWRRWTILAASIQKLPQWQWRCWSASLCIKCSSTQAKHMDKDNKKIWLEKGVLQKADKQSKHAQPCWDPEGVLCFHGQLMASSLITNSHPPFLSVLNFSSYSIVCALPPLFSSPSYSSAIQPLHRAPCSLNLCLTCFICPSPAVLWVPTLLFCVSAGLSRPGAGIWLTIVDLERAIISKQASAWMQGPRGVDKTMAKTLMLYNMR